MKIIFAVQLPQSFYNIIILAARDHWKKKYYEEKKKTAPLDEHLAKLRRELDTLNRRQIGRLEKELDGNQDHATIALVR